MKDVKKKIKNFFKRAINTSKKPPKNSETKQNITKQNKIYQNKTKQNRTKQNKTKQNKQTSRFEITLTRQMRPGLTRCQLCQMSQ